MKPQIQVFAQYCDDVRREADGRVSLMGIYPGDIPIPKGTEAISRIAIQAIILIPTFIDLDLPSISVSVQLDENEPLRSLSLPAELAEELAQAQHNKEDKVERVTMSFIIELKNIKVSAHNALRTFAHIGGATLEGPPLNIRRTSRSALSTER